MKASSSQGIIMLSLSPRSGEVTVTSGNVTDRSEENSRFLRIGYYYTCIAIFDRAKCFEQSA